MKRSTYENPIPESYRNIAKAHGPDGKPRALPRGYEAMPELAASGLWTTPTDFAQLIIALINSYQGGKDGFLSTALAHEMMSEMGRTMFGLGPFLDGEGFDRRFYHSGANDSYRTWTEGHLATGNGLVIFTNGANGNKLYPEMRRAVALAEGWASTLDGHVSAPFVTLSESELKAKEGVYQIRALPSSFSFRRWSHEEIDRVSYREGALYLTEGDDTQTAHPIPLDTSHFVLDESNALRGAVRLEFVKDYSGDIKSLIIRDGKQAILEAEKRVTAQ